MKCTNSPLHASTQLIRINRMGMCSASVFFQSKITSIWRIDFGKRNRLFLSSVLSRPVLYTCIFWDGGVSPGWYSLGCVEISDPPGSWCGCSFVTVNSKFDSLWGFFSLITQVCLPRDGWAGQTNLAPISGHFCLQHSLQALVSLLLTVLPLLAAVLIWALSPFCVVRAGLLEHIEKHCC